MYNYYICNINNGVFIEPLFGNNILAASYFQVKRKY